MGRRPLALVLESVLAAPVLASAQAGRPVVDRAFAARWGSGCGTPFDAPAFLEKHPQFEWMDGILPSRGSHPRVEFEAGA
jgi:hypothetical protein